MATGGADPLAEFCEELLSCDVCSEDFNTDDRTPRILPCFHSFCESCLKQITKDGKCQCPKCRNEVMVSGRFPMDTTRMTLLDKKRSLQSQEGVSCEGCTKGNKATARCQECEEFLCGDCCNIHRQVNATKRHALVSFTEGMKNLDKSPISSEKCGRHADKNLEVYCLTCSAAACSICVVTMHRNCKKLVEVDSVLDKKKKEMLLCCEELEKLEQSFQAKAEESEASVEAVDSHLDQAVHKVEGAISEIINNAMERQAEIIGELRVKAKGDRLLLGEQSTSFRSLQAACQSAAQFGRRCVALNLVSQVFSQTPELNRTIQKLREKTTTQVESAPDYKVSMEKLAELQALLQELGRMESRAVLGAVEDLPVPAPQAVGRTVEGLPLILPSIQLDTTRCGSGCCVGADKCSLSNQPCTHSHCQPQSQSFRFAGTCGTQPLPGTNSYWQVRLSISFKTKIKGLSDLCEFGVATQQALQTFQGDWWISCTDHCAMTVLYYIDKDEGLRYRSHYRKHNLSYTFSSRNIYCRHVDETLGLLLDTATSRVHVLDIRNTGVLCSSYIDLSTPVWPVVHVWPESHNEARVDVEVQSGQQIEMSEQLVKWLQILLEKKK